MMYWLQRKVKRRERRKAGKKERLAGFGLVHVSVGLELTWKQVNFYSQLRLPERSWGRIIVISSAARKK